jgi:hypothetical protein
MPEHEIRLRAAWDGTFRDGVRRVDLPACWAAGEERPSRLARRFQSPRLDPRSECLFIRLVDVPGLTEIHLDGRPLLVTPGTGGLEVELPGGLPGSHRLELELGGEAVRGECTPGGWGRVSLVIRGTDDPAAVGGERG